MKKKAELEEAEERIKELENIKVDTNEILAIESDLEDLIYRIQTVREEAERG